MNAADELVAALDRWETSGGHWRLLIARSDRWVFGLFTCDGGEEMSRVEGPPSAALEKFLDGRSRSDE